VSHGVPHRERGREVEREMGGKEWTKRERREGEEREREREREKEREREG